MWKKTQPDIAGFDDGESSHKPKNAGQGKEIDYFLWRNHSSLCLDFDQQDLSGIFDHLVIYLSCFQVSV